MRVRPRASIAPIRSPGTACTHLASASGECPHELLIVSGLSPSIDRNQAFGLPRGLCPSRSALRTPLPRVPPSDRIHMYSPEIARRLAYIREIHLYFSMHRSLSARCDLPRVSYIPPHPVCGHVCRSTLPTLPMGPRVPLYDHVYASAAAYVDVEPQICLYSPSPSRTQRRSHRPPPPRVYRSLATRMAPKPRATTELPVSLHSPGNQTTTAPAPHVGAG